MFEIDDWFFFGMFEIDDCFFDNFKVDYVQLPLSYHGFLATNLIPHL